MGKMSPIKKFFLTLSMILLMTFGAGSLTSCNDPIVVEKYSEIVSEGLYGAGDAINAGRFDLAQPYIIDLEKIIPLPKNRIVITPVSYQGINYVVLQDTFKNAKVIIVGSDEFNTLLKEKQINVAQQKAADNFAQQAANQAKVDAAAMAAVVAENADLKKQLASAEVEVTAWHNSLEYKIEHLWYIAEFGVPILIVGLILLAIFCPAAIPFIAMAGNVLGSALGLFIKILGGIFSFFGALFSGGLKS